MCLTDFRRLCSPWLAAVLPDGQCAKVRGEILAFARRGPSGRATHENVLIGFSFSWGFAPGCYVAGFQPFGKKMFLEAILLCGKIDLPETTCRGSVRRGRRTQHARLRRRQKHFRLRQRLLRTRWRTRRALPKKSFGRSSWAGARETAGWRGDGSGPTRI